MSRELVEPEIETTVPELRAFFQHGAIWRDIAGQLEYLIECEQRTMNSVETGDRARQAIAGRIEMAEEFLDSESALIERAMEQAKDGLNEPEEDEEDAEA